MVGPAVTWQSRTGTTCEIYAEKNYCTGEKGGYGPGWLNPFGTFASYAKDGVDATTACADKSRKKNTRKVPGCVDALDSVSVGTRTPQPRAGPRCVW